MDYQVKFAKKQKKNVPHRKIPKKCSKKVL